MSSLENYRWPPKAGVGKPRISVDDGEENLERDEGEEVEVSRELLGCEAEKGEKWGGVGHKHKGFCFVFSPQAPRDACQWEGHCTGLGETAGHAGSSAGAGGWGGVGV